MEPLTEPMQIPEQLCGWCEIRLAAVPEDPKQIEPDGRYYHPVGCIAAARLEALGLIGRTDTAPVQQVSVTVSVRA